MNKKQLYNSIMEKVAIEVKKALNEGYPAAIESMEEAEEVLEIAEAIYRELKFVGARRNIDIKDLLMSGASLKMLINPVEWVKNYHGELEDPIEFYREHQREITKEVIALF